MHILDAKIISNKKIAKNTYLLSFKAESIVAEARPGQFLMLRLKLPTTSILRRPFSICFTNNDKGEAFILYRIRGKITGYMSKLKNGESISVMGPLGKGFDIPDDTSQLVLIGGGIGIAPLISVLPLYKGRITLIAGYGSVSDYINIKELIKTECSYIVCTEDGSLGHRGTCVDVFKDYIRTSISRNLVVLSCGPVPMLKKIAEISDQWSIPSYVSLETYMGCGTGLCQGCVVRTRYGYRRVCKEGPIFRTEDICWNQMWI